MSIRQITYKPAHQLKVNGRDISDTTQSRLVRLTLVDHGGSKSDQLTMVLDDHDGRLAIPPRKARIQLALGWQGQHLADKGEFIVDEAGHSGPPDQLTIVARSANFTSNFSEKTTKSWHQVTVGDILKTIAEKHGLDPAISEILAERAIEHIDQTNEGDANFLTRLGKRYGAMASVKNGRLIFKTKGDGLTVSGIKLPATTVKKRDCSLHRYNDNSQDQYTGVKCYWHNKETGNKSTIVLGEEGKVKTLRSSLPTKEEAEHVAAAEWQQLQRAGQTLSLTLSTAIPELLVESPITVKEFKPEINSQDWVGKNITHIVGSGYTQRIDLEVKLP
ncbi:phage late control D family protein [Maricurvus nonylphenolicus]|uniref:contractile injection system protein, VgrG/Pvc8 family n=1 Tax=Maricurvus nonylphenolicus TaxID=1008307 RepID=UPI0036F3BBA3